MINNRITDPVVINADSVVEQVSAGNRVTIQFSSPIYDMGQLELVNALAKQFGRNLELRFYGHNSTIFDGSVLSAVPDVQCLAVDCMMTASNLDALSKIYALKELSLGVFEIEDNNILMKCNLESLESIRLGDTKDGGINLSVLAACKMLSQFHTAGHFRNISAIASLDSLVDITISSMRKKDDLSFLSGMPQLTSLRLMLGGHTTLADITPANLKNLEIIRIKGLENIGSLGRFEALESFLIEDQIRLERIALGPNPKLRDIKIINCKTLENITGLSSLKCLSKLRISRTALNYEVVIEEGMPRSLEVLAFYTGKSSRDAIIRADLDARGFREFERALD